MLSKSHFLWGILVIGFSNFQEYHWFILIWEASLLYLNAHTFYLECYVVLPPLLLGRGHGVLGWSITGLCRIPCYWGADPGYGVRNNEIKEKMAKNRLIWLFLPRTHGVSALPLHPLDTSVGIFMKRNVSCVHNLKQIRILVKIQYVSYMWYTYTKCWIVYNHTLQKQLPQDQTLKNDLLLALWKSMQYSIFASFM